jgi:hypothetical protein
MRRCLYPLLRKAKLPLLPHPLSRRQQFTTRFPHHSLNPPHQLPHPLRAGPRLLPLRLTCLGQCRRLPRILRRLLLRLRQLQRNQTNGTQISIVHLAHIHRLLPSKRFRLRHINTCINQMASQANREPRPVYHVDISFIIFFFPLSTVLLSFFLLSIWAFRTLHCFERKLFYKFSQVAVLYPY